MIQKTGKMSEIEETVVICDFCKRDTTSRMLDNKNGIEHAGQFWCGYGYYSKRDGDKLSLDMCCECATEVENLLRDKWPNLPKTENNLWD